MQSKKTIVLEPAIVDELMAKHALAEVCKRDRVVIGLSQVVDVSIERTRDKKYKFILTVDDE